MPAATMAMVETTPPILTLKLLAPLVAVLDAAAEDEEDEEDEAEEAALVPLQQLVHYFQGRIAYIHILSLSAFV